MLWYVFDRKENIVGKVENAGYQHFLLFTQCFQKGSTLASLKAWVFRKNNNNKQTIIHHYFITKFSSKNGEKKWLK